jgi:iron(III) transport system ATP-binding protein
MARLTLDGVTRRYGKAAAVDGASLEVADGEFLAVLGPSGCGKTTLLRLVAGFDPVDEGTIAFDGAVVSGPGTHVPAERRRVGIVFQSYALWPHMTAADNVAYPLRTARVPAEEARRRTEAALETVGLAGMGGRRPAELSGGQRQRVALARCLVMEPRLVLLDEPLANLDVHLRAAMEDEFARFHRETRATMVYITHDQAEAMALADRVAVMDRGRVVQAAAPRVLYREPATEMVAGFVGRGAVVHAFCDGTGEGGRARVHLADGMVLPLRCPPGVRAGPARLCLRPEDLEIADDGLPATVRRTSYKGGAVAVEAETALGRLQLTLPDGAAPEPGSAVRIAVRDGWVIPG